MEHFIEEHTYERYDFAKTGSKQSFWPKGTDVTKALEDAIDGLRAQGITIQLNAPVSVRLSNGIMAQIGVRPGLGGVIIGQFFALHGPGVEAFIKAELRAMEKILVK